MLNLRLLCCMLCVISCRQSTKSQKKEELNKPNIVFLFADDYTYEAIHAFGNKYIETPSLDKLVAEGTTFTHAYNMGGWQPAVCVASRSMILSGRSVWNAENIAKKWSKGDTIALNNTWGKLMETQGYNTYMTGKWHIQAPANYVFNTARNVKPGMPDDNFYKKGKVGYNRPIDENDNSWSASDTSQGGFWKGGKHWSEIIKDDAIDFINDAKKKEDPFFMYLAFNAPHDPRQSPQSFLDKYDIEKIPLPENWLPEYPYKDSIGSPSTLRDEALAPFPRTPYAIKTHIKEYYSIITHLDEQVGKILEAIEASGKADNTYIFFTGDHGLSVGHHGLLGKQSLFDHSIRVPLMVVGPDIPKNIKVSKDVYLQDIMATSLELANIEKPSYVDFNSFLDLAKETTKSGNYEEGIYGAYVDFQRMIRKDGYKLLVYPKINKVLLFDMKKDPQEMHNLSKDPSQKERVKMLFSSLMDLQNKMADNLDLTSIYQSL